MNKKAASVVSILQMNLIYIWNVGITIWTM